jgi:Domain of unknown function (DUF5658)
MTTENPVVISARVIKPAPSTGAIIVFACLQALDVITTLLGWRAGAREANIVVVQFMHLGPITGLMFGKLLGLLLILLVILRGKLRMIRLLNLWFAGIVTWNLVIVWLQVWTTHAR